MTAPSLAAWYGADTGPRPAAPQLPPIGAERLFSAWLDSKAPDTILNYRLDMELFAKFIGAPNAEAGAKVLLGRSNGEANLLALEFKNDMMKRGLAAASVNRRLSSLRSFTKAARRVGVVPWTLEFDRVPEQPYRDVRGMGRDGVEKMLAKLRQQSGPSALRDIAIVKLGFDRGLRAKEITTLDLADVDLERGAVNVLGKMRRAKEWLSLAPSTTEALAQWIAARGATPGPLFIRFHFGYGPGRLTRQGVLRIVRKLGEAAKLPRRATTHQLRHSSITAALDAGADVRAVQRFSRHKSINTVLLYDDARRDLARDVALLVAEPKGEHDKPRAQTSPQPPTAALVRVPTPVPTPRELGRKRGEASKQAKITEAAVLSIRARHAAGEGPSVLAKSFGVSVTQVANIVSRRSWAHVGGESRRRQRRKPVRLSDADVAEIRRRRAAGESAEALAELFRTSPQNVVSIATGRTRRPRAA